MTAHRPHDAYQKTALGVWTYLMSDAILFAGFFAAYAVLRSMTAEGPDAPELFSPLFVLIETLVLLTSSFTCGLATLAARERRTTLLWVALGATGALGMIFIGMEVTEFSRLIADGAGPQTSAFLSSFFALVGLHGLHVAAGIIWLAVLCAHLGIRGVTPQTERGVQYFSLFWHFLDIVWICLFSLVYLLGLL